MVKSAEKKCKKYAPLPPEWVSAPLFPPLPQTEPYTVVFGNGRYRFTSGCGNPLPYTRNEGKSPYLRGFDIRHYDLIALLLAEYNSGRITPDGDFFIGYHSLLNAIGKDIGTKQIEALSLLLDDLWNTNLCFEDSNAGSRVIFRALSQIETREMYGKKCLIRVQLDPTFVKFINTVKDFVCIRLDVKVRLPSLVAQSLYTYLPSRAVTYHGEQKWKIGLARLMEELRIPAERYPTAYRRMKFFTQNKNSIISQLDNLPIASGNMFRVELEQTRDKKDYNLCCWTDVYVESEKESKVLNWWLEAGRTRQEFFELMNRKKTISGYTKEKLADMGFDVVKDEPYLNMCQALYQGDFDEMVGDVASRFQSPENDINNIFAYFTGWVKNSFPPDGQQELPFPTEGKEK